METLRRSCWHIMRTLGTGHSEKVYHCALITALNKAKVFHRSEVVCAIRYLGETVGYGKADLVLDDLVVELKATTRAPVEFTGQIKKYVESLTQSEKRAFRAVVVNFNQRSAQVDIWVSPFSTKVVTPPKRTLVRSRFFLNGNKLLVS